MSITLKHPLVLASGSPRRQALLREAGYVFDVVASSLTEPSLPENQTVNAGVWAEALAYFKARSVSVDLPNAIIIGADTVVVHGDQILGKATDVDDARRILTTLFGGKNQVITGVAILRPGSSERIITHVSTTLMMREMNSHEVEDYLASGAWRDKAGAYALQEGGDQFLKSIEGSTSNVVGLPMEKLNELLRPFLKDQVYEA